MLTRYVVNWWFGCGHAFRCSVSARWFFSIYNTYCPIMKNVSMYSILTRKKSIKHPLRLLERLVFAGWCFLRDSSSSQPKYWTPFVTEPRMILGSIMMKPSSHVYRRRLPRFQGKIQTEMQKMGFQRHVTLHSTA